MSASDMTMVVERKLTDKASAVPGAHGWVTRAVELWFEKYGKKIHPEHHYLRLNPVKLFQSETAASFERTADLMLKQEATTNPSKYEFGKILCRRALIVKVSWPR
jgi:hypothetical protein